MNLEKLNKKKVKCIAKKSKDKAIDMAISLKGRAVKSASAFKEKASAKWSGPSADLGVLKKVNFNFHHFVSVCLIAIFAFFVTLYSTGANTTKVDAAGLDAPKLVSYNKDAVDVNYGDSKGIANVAKDILEGQVSKVAEIKEISNSGMTSIYEIEDFKVTVHVENATGIGEKNAKIEVQTNTTYEKDADEKIVVLSQEKQLVNEGTVYVYEVNLNVIDNEAPRINLSEADMTMDDTDEFDIKNFVSVTDNVDGIVENYTVEGMFAKNEDKWESGKHVITIRAKDSSGNEAASEMIVRIYETEEEKVVETVAANAKNTNGRANTPVHSGAGAYAGANSVAQAALAQLGVTQDCTMLVTNSLRAVGIYFHDWPAGYLSLGTVVSAAEAQPGDIIYYADGGIGMAHVAVYIGNGQAVHGGYLGSTKIASAYMGSGPVFIRLR